jgi:vacuolar-type H+-ATPase subunit I/STV1
MSATEFNAQCETSGRAGWKARVDDVDCEAHALRLDKLREEIALAIHEETGMELCDIVVRLEGVFPDILERYRSAHSQLAEATRLRDDAAKEIRSVVATLRDEKLTMRDISALLGITPQRVAQLVHSDSRGE